MKNKAAISFTPGCLLLFAAVTAIAAIVAWLIMEGATEVQKIAPGAVL